MAKLSELVGDPPFTDPLPQFGTWSNYDGRAQLNIYNSNYELLSTRNPGAPSGSNIHQFWGGGVTSEIGNSSGYWYTNGTIGSGGVTSYWGGATPWFQADCHFGMQIPGLNALNGAIVKEPGTLITTGAYWGVVVGKRGIRQRISLYQSNSTIQIHQRGMRGYLEIINVNNAAYSTWAGRTSNGMIGYNDRTRTLVALEGDGSNNYRMHIWKNYNDNRSLNEENYNTGTLRLFLSEAKTGGSSGLMANYNFYDFTWSETNSVSYNESRYRMRVVPGDNGIIGLARMVPSNQVQYATYNPATSTLTTAGYPRLGLTTSYGIDQSVHYGMRHQITWDNEWVAAYAPYYYYACGMMTYFINTVDPTKTYNASNTGTSHGAVLLPLGEDKFVYKDTASNSDGSVGFVLWTVDVGGYYRYGKRPTGEAIANNSTIGYTWTEGMYYTFDTRYTSTNYPWIMPVDKWVNM